MKRFILKLLLFSILLWLCDFALSGVFKLYDYTNQGAIHKVHEITTSKTPQLLVLGSSRASHHYDSRILQDSLGIEVFNAGLDGKGLAIGYGLFAAVSQRGYPKYIICELTPSFDLQDESGSATGLNMLYPYIYNPTISKLICDFDESEKFKLYSNAYRLNSSLFRLIPSIFMKNEDSLSGFIPLYGKLDKEIEKTNKDSEENVKDNISDNKIKVDPVKEKYLRSLIEQARSNGCEIFFAISPVYGGDDLSSYKEELEIINEYNGVLLNHLNDASIIYDSSLFQDRTHMNVDGARLFTNIIIQEIREYDKNKNCVGHTKD